MPRWLVLTPSYTYVEPVLEDGSGPTERTCDVIDVVAPTKREAIKIGVRRMLKENKSKGWVQYQQEDGKCPYTGITAILHISELK